MRGAKIRQLVKGKPEYISRHVQKLFPLEFLSNPEPDKNVGNDTKGIEEENGKGMEKEMKKGMKKDITKEMKKEMETGREVKVKESKNVQHAVSRAPRRAVFRDASLRNVGKCLFGK